MACREMFKLDKIKYEDNVELIEEVRRFV